MGLNLTKMRRQLEATVEARASKRRYPAHDDIEQELAKHRWAISVLTQALYTSKSAHAVTCHYRCGQDRGECTCEIGRLIRQVKRKLRR